MSDRPTELCTVTWRMWLEAKARHPRDPLDDCGDQRFARDARHRLAELERTLTDIEMETRDGAQWTREEINELCRAVLREGDSRGA